MAAHSGMRWDAQFKSWPRKRLIWTERALVPVSQGPLEVGINSVWLR
jgi:hypothetical protein